MPKLNLIPDYSKTKAKTDYELNEFYIKEMEESLECIRENMSLIHIEYKNLCRRIDTFRRVIT